MKRLILAGLLLGFLNTQILSGQEKNDTSVYLITCAPGTETYSAWGHSALRVVIPGSGTDMVYNWGVFDFNTPNFAWKFAKGRLNYMLGVYPYNRFLQDYLLTGRSVWSQEINLEPVEKLRLMLLLEQNMKPENRYYRYDFFYDDCSSRIRDFLEKILGSRLIYPPDEGIEVPTFRKKIAEYTRNYPWLRFGIDFLMGMSGERKTTFRDRMFLPYDLQRNLSAAVINRDRKMIPLLQSSVKVLDFPEPGKAGKFYTSPFFIFTLFFVLIAMISVWLRKSQILHFIDIGVFLAFSILSALMIFFNFFTDHEQMRMNLNIIWLNPFVIVTLLILVFGREGKMWFRLVFALALIFIPFFLIFPGSINPAFLPLVLTLLIRSSARSGFTWNPLSV